MILIVWFSLILSCFEISKFHILKRIADGMELKLEENQSHHNSSLKIKISFLKCRQNHFLLLNKILHELKMKSKINYLPLDGNGASKQI